MKVAVIGGGIAGLTAAYELHRHHDIFLYERAARLGGNAYTIDTRRGDTVDIAVAAFGRAGYPRFYALLHQLGITPSVSPGAFVSVHDRETNRGFYATPSLTGLLEQRFAALAPRHLVDLARLAWGMHRGQELRAAGALSGKTLREALAMIPALRGEGRLMFLCALCLLSSMSGEEVLAAPAEFFFDKLAVHADVMSPRAFYSIRCVRGGTRRYVDALAARLGGRLALGAQIHTVRRSSAGITLVLADGATRSFDRVVLACNADQALALLEEPTEDERRLLGAWRYKEGRVVVHTDASAFPPRPLIQAYTFLYRQRGDAFDTSVNGALWREPGVRSDCPYISTQHPNFPIRRESIELETTLRTPHFDFASVPTIRELPRLNGVLHTYYCGSHFGFGLHEDAVASAQAAAAALVRSVRAPN